jgi:nucleotide-binding universal stress UspA family protein
MFHRIILAVDLADPTAHPKGLDQALELATQSGGDLRLVNVQPLLPATFMEYVPADFDEEQEKRAKTALDAIAAKLPLPKEWAAASITSFCATRPSGAPTSSSWVRTGR